MTDVTKMLFVPAPLLEGRPIEERVTTLEQHMLASSAQMQEHGKTLAIQCAKVEAQERAVAALSHEVSEIKDSGARVEQLLRTYVHDNEQIKESNNRIEMLQRQILDIVTPSARK